MVIVTTSPRDRGRSGRTRCDAHAVVAALGGRAVGVPIASAPGGRHGGRARSRVPVRRTPTSPTSAATTSSTRDTRPPRCGSARTACAPAGRRSFGLLMPGTGTASGPVHRVDSVADTTVAGFSARADDGSTGVAYVWYVSPGIELRPGLGRSGRPQRRPAWQYVDTTAATYTWQLVDGIHRRGRRGCRHVDHRRLHRRERRRSRLPARRLRLRRRRVLGRRAPLRQRRRGDDLRPRGDHRHDHHGARGPQGQVPGEPSRP